MYFEPTKKTYYRFPSSNSINNLDLKYYFPEKSRASEDDIRTTSHSGHSSVHYDSYINF